MKAIFRILQVSLAMFVIAAVLPVSQSPGPEPNFHNAPASAKELKNPYEGQPAPRQGVVPSALRPLPRREWRRLGEYSPLKAERIKAVTPGEIFWFITKGDVPNGMPSWATLPKQQRWQIVSYVQTLGQPQRSQAASRIRSACGRRKLNAPPPSPPFTDFRYEKPGKIRKITVKDLPAPFATSSAGNGPKVVARPEGAWPQVPEASKWSNTRPDSTIRGSSAPLPTATFSWPRPRPATSGFSAASPATASPRRWRFCQRPERALRHQFLSSRPESGMGLCGQH